LAQAEYFDRSHDPVLMTRKNSGFWRFGSKKAFLRRERQQIHKVVFFLVIQTGSHDLSKYLAGAKHRFMKRAPISDFFVSV
jgi:hypothetical protein